MRTIPIAAAALLLLGSTAIAQTQPRSPATPGATTTPAQVHRAKNPLTQEDLSKVEGTSVYGSDDSSIGRVSEVLMNPESKKVDRLVVAAGGVLGIGSHRVAIPLDQFSWDGDTGAFRLKTTLAEVKAMPEWAEGATATGSSQPPKGATAPASSGNGPDKTR